MLARFRPRRPSHGTVVAYVALFVALGGTTYAAATIGSSDIKKNAVLSRHIKDGQVRSGDLSPKLKDSLKLHCPSGLVRAGDICFELSQRPNAAWYDAVKICARAQRRLPDAGELALAFDHLGAPQPFQWVTATFTNGTNVDAAILEDNSSRDIVVGSSDRGTATPYRCVTSATN